MKELPHMKFIVLYMRFGIFGRVSKDAFIIKVILKHTLSNLQGEMDAQMEKPFSK
jgi:hypothetical protein